MTAFIFLSRLPASVHDVPCSGRIENPARYYGNFAQFWRHNQSIGSYLLQLAARTATWMAKLIPSDV